MSDSTGALTPNTATQSSLFHAHDPMAGFVLLSASEFPKLAEHAREHCDACQGPCKGAGE